MLFLKESYKFKFLGSLLCMRKEFLQKLIQLRGLIVYFTVGPIQSKLTIYITFDPNNNSDFRPTNLGIHTINPQIETV